MFSLLESLHHNTENDCALCGNFSTNLLAALMLELIRKRNLDNYNGSPSIMVLNKVRVLLDLSAHGTKLYQEIGPVLIKHGFGGISGVVLEGDLAGLVLYSSELFSSIENFEYKHKRHPNQIEIEKMMAELTPLTFIPDRLFPIPETLETNDVDMKSGRLYRISPPVYPLDKYFPNYNHVTAMVVNRLGDKINELHATTGVPTDKIYQVVLEYLLQQLNIPHKAVSEWLSQPYEKKYYQH